MATTFKTLYKSGALGSGAKLWIFPKLENSAWTQTIDWYLNFQISRSKQFEFHQPDSELNELVNSFEIPPTEFHPTDRAPLCLASQGRLPGEQLVEMPSVEDPKLWTQRVHQIWQQLKCPSLRIFLPNSISVADFQTLWPRDVPAGELTLVPPPHLES